MAFNVFTDGASRGNPGESGVGIVIYEDKLPVQQISQYLGTKTNNEAEYIAVIRAMEFLKKIKVSEANFFCDSQLLVRQLEGQYKVKAPTIIPLYNEAKQHMKTNNFKFHWIRREDNTVADELANKAIDEKDI